MDGLPLTWIVRYMQLLNGFNNKLVLYGISREMLRSFLKLLIMKVMSSSSSNGNMTGDWSGIFSSGDVVGVGIIYVLRKPRVDLTVHGTLSMTSVIGFNVDSRVSICGSCPKL